MVSLLDDSPGEEIALLIMMLAAATAAEAPQQNAEPPCSARRVLVEYVVAEPVPVIPSFGWSPEAKAQTLLVSKIIEPDSTAPKHDIMPQAEPSAKGPAVLTPGCKAEQRKKKDYQMA